MLLLYLAAGKSRLVNNFPCNLIKQPRRSLIQFKSTKPNASNRTQIFSNPQKKQFLNLKLSKNGTKWFGNMAGAGKGTGATNAKKAGNMKSSEIIAKLIRFVWPKDKTGIKVRVVVALSLLIGSKLLNVCVPFIFKEIVDFLNKNTQIKDFASTTQEKLVLTMIVLVIGYGAARAGASLFGELRNAIFARVAQSSVTQLATQVANF